MNPNWRKNYLRYKSFFLNILGRYKEREDIKAYLEILLSLATVSVFSIFALRPTLITISTLIKDIESKEDTIERMDVKLDNLTQARALYSRETSKINNLRQSIPENSNPEVLVRQVEGLAQENQVSVTSFSLGNALILGEEDPTPPDQESNQEQPPPEGSGILAFSLAAQGDYSNLINLLRSISSLRRPATTNSVTFRTEEVDQPSQEQNQSVLIFSVRAQAPYLKKSPIPENINQ